MLIGGKSATSLYLVFKLIDLCSREKLMQEYSEIVKYIYKLLYDLNF